MTTSVTMASPFDIPLDVPPGADPDRALPADLSDPTMVGAALGALIESGRLDLPLPAAGSTATRWRALADLAVNDVTLARLADAHAGAVAILDDLGGPAPERDQRWGVWDVDTPVSPLVARWGPDGWTLHGARSSCSGARVLTHALVTAEITAVRTGEARQLFAVRLDDRNIAVAAGGRASQMMTGADTATVLFDGAQAVPVGGPVGTPGRSGAVATYTDRPVFWHAAAGVAACWFGGAIGVARPLFAAGRLGRADHEGWADHSAGQYGSAGHHGPAGQHARPLDARALAHLGRVDALLMAGRCVLETAAREIDADPDDAGGSARRRALQVRATIEAGAAEVIDLVGRALGPGPLCSDRGYARRVADLGFYLRHSHVEHDLEALAGVVLDDLDPFWW
ncbi:acyl-CoA dehydrogenase [Candidatus Protofrankia californiensis]|uniref:acyl-CoA dehydrogenase n=1 Tax=Candidatus Protofrankia californiensis TaxID=1839754 RepID=UPI0019D07C5C|nr:acyl-CoA dehydrogenase [Candidatus Protofrankia californiensis]